jgi:hypothetical protein
MEEGHATSGERIEWARSGARKRAEIRRFLAEIGFSCALARPKSPQMGLENRRFWPEF